MGKALSYCYKCSTLLREDDFAQGKAVRFADHVACAACAPEAAPSKPPSSSTVHRAPPAPSTRRVAKVIPPKKTGLIAAAAGGGALLLVIVIVALSSSKRERPTPAPEEAPKSAVTPKEAPDPGRAALEGARRWAREHPADLPGQVQEFQRVALQWEKSPSGQEALREVERVKREVRARVGEAYGALEREIQAPLERKDYAAALKILEEARKRFADPEWDLGVGKRTREVRDLRDLEDSKAKKELVAHWTFDEGTGTAAGDSSGNGHTGRLNGNAAWTSEGKIGGAIRFDGVSSWVEIPNDAGVENVQEESYTLALWFKPEGVPPGQGDQNTAAYGLLEKPGWHLGLHYSAERRFQAEHWLEGQGNAGTGTWDEAYPPGAFYHVAGVVDRPAGTIRIFVNGELKKESRWKAGAPTHEYHQNPWRIGMANPGASAYAWPAKGVIDDVRVYARALTAEDVRNLHEAVR